MRGKKIGIVSSRWGQRINDIFENLNSRELIDFIIGTEHVEKYHNIYIVYTKEAETADQYIEKTVHKIGRQHQVTVATSDGLEQIIIMGQGASRISARGLKEEIEETRKQLRQEWHQHRQSSHTYLFDHADAETAKLMEEVRLGKKKL